MMREAFALRSIRPFAVIVCRPESACTSTVDAASASTVMFVPAVMSCVPSVF